MLLLLHYRAIRRVADMASGGENVENVITWPGCMECGDGVLVPLSDFGSQGAAVHYKAWVCIKPSCGFNLKIRNGEININEPILEGGSGRR